jgi:hypothetical protein
MGTKTVQDGAPRLANGEHVDGLMDNQEGEQQKAGKRSQPAIQIERERLAWVGGRTPNVRAHSPVTQDTVNIWDRWMQEVSEDRFRATTTFKRKIIQEVGDKSGRPSAFRVRLPGRGPADGKAVLAIVVANPAAASARV